MREISDAIDAEGLEGSMGELDYMSLMEGTLREVGRLLLSDRSRHPEINSKGSRELVTDLDREADRILTDVINRSLPGHRVLSEETRSTVTRENWRQSQVWIIDPIDGTANFIRGIDLFCTAAALYDHGVGSAALVYDPSRDEMFTAVRGQGVKLNGRSVRVNAVDALSRAVLATGFPYERIACQDNTDHIAHLVPLVSDLRRSGSGILDMAWVACGRLDGYFEHGLPPWDAAAGLILVEEASGKATDYRGGPFNPFLQDMCVTNGAIHDALLTVLQKGTSGIRP
jgi:myo-inositol-1(or 4)-monophosphatase